MWASPERRIPLARLRAFASGRCTWVVACWPRTGERWGEVRGSREAWHGTRFTVGGAWLHAQAVVDDRRCHRPQGGVVAARVVAHAQEGVADRHSVAFGGDALGLLDEHPGAQRLLELLVDLLQLLHL